MRRSKTAVLSLGLVLGAGAVLLARGQGPASAAPPSVSVGTVDILRIFREAPGKTDIDAKREKNKKEIDDWMEKQKANIERLRADAMKATKLEQRDKDVALEREKTLTEFDYKAKVTTAIKAYADSQAALYNQVRGAINAVAAQQGYSLVLFKSPEDEPMQLDEGSNREFVLNVAMRPVLHATAEIDFTQQVISYLQQQRPPAPPSTPAPGK